MNIEESAERVKKWCEFYRLREKTNIDFLFSIAEKDIPIEAIETLLTAYEKEKEKNSKLIKALDTVNHEKSVFIESYEKEKEKNKELSDKLTEKICKGVEEEILQEYRQIIIDKDKLIEELKKYKK